MVRKEVKSQAEDIKGQAYKTPENARKNHLSFLNQKVPDTKEIVFYRKKG